MISLKACLKKAFSHPLADKVDINSRYAVDIHRRIIRENPLLIAHYALIYKYFKRIDDSVSNLKYSSLEIGSGGGFLKEFLPDVITSDVVKSEGIDRIENACALSFGDNSLKAIYANGVLHHIKDPAKCLFEIERVLVPGGRFVCNEPSSTLFGYFMNSYFHNEHTDKRVKDWKIDENGASGRLSRANMALPYIIFKRDAALFRERFKMLKIDSIAYHDFLRYTLSGGLSYRPFVPKILFGAVNFMEEIFKPVMFILGNNMLVTIQKQ